MSILGYMNNRGDVLCQEIISSDEIFVWRRTYEIFVALSSTPN